MRTIIIGLFGFAGCVAALFIVSRVAAGTPTDLHSGAGRAPLIVSDRQIDNEQTDNGTLIRSTRRISIPYGFDSPLPLDLAEQRIRASGEGACTAGEDVTIAVTITQAATGATAVGETVASCTGQVQRWSAIAAVQSGAAIAPGTAEACGVATTRQEGEVTDTFEWCRDVALHVRVYLPVVIRP